MTGSDPQATGAASSGLPRESQRMNQVIGAVIILIAVGLITWLTVAARVGCSTADLAFVAYVPGQVELRADTRVEFYGQCVGRVDGVLPGLAAMQLNVERTGTLERRESLTISSRDPEATVEDGGLVFRFAAPGTVEIDDPSASTRTLTRRVDGFWSVDGPPLIERGLTGDTIVRPGALLDFGQVGVEWSDVGRFTRVSGFIDASAFEEVAEAVGLDPSLRSIESTLGAGTSISVGSRIGINMSGPPQVRLVPSFADDQLVAEEDGVREFSPLAGTDVLAFLGEAVDYLAAPGKSEAPPVNRYERLVDDLGGSLTQLRAAVSSARRFADTLGAVADAGGDQLAGRLVLGERQVEVLEGALMSIDTVLSAVESSVSEDPERPVLGLLFTDDQAESLDRTVDNVRSLSDELRDGSKTVFTRIAGENHGVRFDSIVVRTERLSARATEMLDQLEESGGDAARSARTYGIVTAVAQALTSIAAIGILFW